MSRKKKSARELDKSHGSRIKAFEKSQGTLADFIRIFKLRRVSTFKDIKNLDVLVEVGDILYDKEDYIIREITVGEDLKLHFSFRKFQAKEEDNEHLYHMIQAMRNLRDY